MSGQIRYGSTNTPQLFGGSANQFVPPNGSQVEEFVSVGPARDPTVNTSVESGGNTADVLGSGANQFTPPRGQQAEEFPSGATVYPPSIGFPGSEENLGADVTTSVVEEFRAGVPVYASTEAPFFL